MRRPAGSISGDGCARSSSAEVAQRARHRPRASRRPRPAGAGPRSCRRCQPDGRRQRLPRARQNRNTRCAVSSGERRRPEQGAGNRRDVPGQPLAATPRGERAASPARRAPPSRGARGPGRGSRDWRRRRVRNASQRVELGRATGSSTRVQRRRRAAACWSRPPRSVRSAQPSRSRHLDPAARRPRAPTSARTRPWETRSRRAARAASGHGGTASRTPATPSGVSGTKVAHAVAPIRVQNRKYRWASGSTLPARREHLAVGRDRVGLGVDRHPRQRVVQLHVRLADAAAATHRRRALRQAVRVARRPPPRRSCETNARDVAPVARP